MASITFGVRSCIRGYHIYKTVQYVDPVSRTRYYVHTWPAVERYIHAPRAPILNFVKNIFVNGAIITKIWSYTVLVSCPDPPSGGCGEREKEGLGTYVCFICVKEWSDLQV